MQGSSYLEKILIRRRTRTAAFISVLLLSWHAFSLYSYTLYRQISDSSTEACESRLPNILKEQLSVAVIPTQFSSPRNNADRLNNNSKQSAHIKYIETGKRITIVHYFQASVALFSNVTKQRITISRARFSTEQRFRGLLWKKKEKKIRFDNSSLIPRGF